VYFYAGPSVNKRSISYRQLLTWKGFFAIPDKERLP
jgi:hypothetical protein